MNKIMQDLVVGGKIVLVGNFNCHVRHIRHGYEKFKVVLDSVIDMRLEGAS